MDRLDDRVGCGCQEAVDVVWTGDRLRLRASVAPKLGPDAGEGAQRAILVLREPDDVFLLRLRVLLRRVFRKTVEGNEAAVLWFEPAAPVRRRGVADVGDRRAGRRL